MGSGSRCFSVFGAAALPAVSLSPSRLAGAPHQALSSTFSPLCGPSSPCSHWCGLEPCPAARLAGLLAQGPPSCRGRSRAVLAHRTLSQPTRAPRSVSCPKEPLDVAQVTVSLWLSGEVAGRGCYLMEENCLLPNLLHSPHCQRVLREAEAHRPTHRLLAASIPAGSRWPSHPTPLADT